MAVYGPNDSPYGTGGWDFDQDGNLIPKPQPGTTTLNTPPPEFATPQGGALINTPNSSTGQPFRQAPSASSFPAIQQGAPGTLTPSSRTGAPAPGVRTLPQSSSVPGWVAPTAGAFGRGGLWGLGGYLMGKTVEPQPTNQGEDEVLKRFVPPPNSTIGTQTGTAPVTQTGPGRSPSGPVPPGPPGPPYRPEDDPRAALPPMTPQAAIPPYPPPRPSATAPYPPPRPRGGGGGGGGGSRGASPGPAPPMVNLQPQPGWTTIDRPNADTAGGPSRAGQLAPQYFNQAREPGGPAQMGAFDFSSLFNHPQVAAAAAQHPMVHAAAAAMAAPRARTPVRGPLAPGALGNSSGSPTPMDIQDRTRGQYPVTGSGSPTPMDVQDQTRGRNRGGGQFGWPVGGPEM